VIIKSHIRAGYRAAADYLKEQGKNEVIRLVEISDPDAKNLDKAFQNMWTVASGSKVKKPLHHISINPFKDERLTDKQVKKIIERCEQIYGYKSGDHQRVVVEHIKEGRQHFHVMWNRVSFATGKAVWPGHHWLKSKQAAREMEVELGLKRPVRRMGKVKVTRGKAFKAETFKPSSIRHHYPASRPARHYAGMLGELPTTGTRKKKDGKSDGSGGGAASTASALRYSSKSYTPSVKKYSGGNIGKGNGPERRRVNMWVGVERRQQRPKHS